MVIKIFLGDMQTLTVWPVNTYGFSVLTRCLTFRPLNANSLAVPFQDRSNDKSLSLSATGEPTCWCFLSYTAAVCKRDVWNAKMLSTTLRSYSSFNTITYTYAVYFLFRMVIPPVHGGSYQRLFKIPLVATSLNTGTWCSAQSGRITQRCLQLQLS